MEDNSAELDQLKSTMKSKVDGEKRAFQVLMDKMKLDLMEA
jgi:hypothetical protein